MLHLSTRGLAAWGFRFRFETDDALLAEVVDRCYRDLPSTDEDAHVLRAVQSAGDGFCVSLQAPGGEIEQCGDGRDRSTVLELLTWEVNRRALQSAAGRVVLHAAVFGGPLGAVALCGGSHCGKSTLAAAAASRGWRHLSDDMGLVDAHDMTVRPYARPVMLRPGGRDHLSIPLMPPEGHLQFFPDEWFVPASELGAQVSAGSVPLVAVGFLHWSDRAVLEPLSRAQTLHDLTLHCATLAAGGVEVFEQLALVARDVPGWRVGLGAASDVLDLVSHLVRPDDEP